MNTTTFNDNILSRNDLSLISNDHIVAECSTPTTTFNQYIYEGTVNKKTSQKEGPGSIYTDAFEFEVWFLNDQPNGSGNLRYKATAFEEEGEVSRGVWKDGKLECEKCSLFIYFDHMHTSYMVYTGPTKNNFVHGKGGVLQMITKKDAGNTFPFTIKGLEFHNGNSINVNKKQNVTITLPFENNTTRTYTITKMNNLWTGLMDRFRGEKCQVVYLDPNNQEKVWDCDDAIIDRMDENYRVRGVLVNLIRFELYWSTKAMGKIPNRPVVLKNSNNIINDEM